MNKIFTERFFSRASIIVVFLALLRLITEFFQLDFNLKQDLTISMIRPYMLGALVCASTAFIMVLLNFYHKYRLVMATAVLAIVALVYIKINML